MGNILTKCCSDDDHHKDANNHNDKKHTNHPYLEHPQPKYDPTVATTPDPHQPATESCDIPLTDRTLTSSSSSSAFTPSVVAVQQFPPPLSQTISSPGNLPTVIDKPTSGKKRFGSKDQRNNTNSSSPSIFKQLSASFTSLTNVRRRSSNVTATIPKSLTLAQGLDTTGVILSDEERKVLLSNEIPASEIEKLSRGVDAGGMGIIHVAEWKGIKVAIKEASPHVICKEVEIYSRMKGCEGVVLFYGVTYPPGLDKLCIVTKYAENGSLSWYLKVAFSKLTWANKLTLAIQISHAIARLHQEGIYHRDLHGGNILIDEQGNGLLTDFGASTVMEERVVRSIDEYAISTLTTPQGGSRFFSQKFPDMPDSSAESSPTNSVEVPDKSSISRKSGNDPLIGVMAYIAPERFRKPSYFDARCDVYSLGVLLWELTSGHSAFAQSPQDVQLAVSILNGKREEAVEGTPAEYQALYERCWDPSPEARPNLDEILTTLERVKGSLSEEQLATTRERNALGNDPEFEASLSIPRPTSDYQNYFNSSSSSEEL
ncbi:hypothetical protein BGZ59_000065 [Podila verticillata]|nr:hypothetical protein BGZ59_000065 [Podila verticillata]KAI9242808.1 MAG: kinase-like domain-containing protein [Podila humilis]KFH65670.1 TKL protein kinase [Podila verticillata NRRL 6337]